jgi:hypothetical protein
MAKWNATRLWCNIRNSDIFGSRKPLNKFDKSLWQVLVPAVLTCSLI